MRLFGPAAFGTESAFLSAFAQKSDTLFSVSLFWIMVCRAGAGVSLLRRFLCPHTGRHHPSACRLARSMAAWTGLEGAERFCRASSAAICPAACSTSAWKAAAGTRKAP